MTTKQKHTPGPWQLGGFGKVYSPGRVPAVDNGLPTAYEVASVPFRPMDALGVHQDETRANARLIAAAPDLLASLKAIVEYEKSPDFSKWKRVIDVAAEAVAKAEAR